MMAEPGSSGGAILNSKNEVLGVHAFRIASGDYQKYNLNTMAEQAILKACTPKTSFLLFKIAPPEEPGSAII